MEDLEGCHDRRARHMATSDETDCAHGECARAIGRCGTVGVVDKDSANVVKLSQNGNCLMHDLCIFTRNIQEVGSAVCSDDDAGIGAVDTFYAVAQKGASIGRMLRSLASNRQCRVYRGACGGPYCGIEDAQVGANTEVHREESSAQGPLWFGFF